MLVGFFAGEDGGRSQLQKAGKRSTNLQAGGDIHIGTPSDDEKR